MDATQAVSEIKAENETHVCREGAAASHRVVAAWVRRQNGVAEILPLVVSNATPDGRCLSVRKLTPAWERAHPSMDESRLTTLRERAIALSGTKASEVLALPFREKNDRAWKVLIAVRAALGLDVPEGE